ncbi:hypothetical protein DFJ74DRAFT_690267 [Hyaloraphidium curvatum]|nr:hypothetical protein DFJ74DRAFT_690267 [Hyaloraphidium curvatum]
MPTPCLAHYGATITEPRVPDDQLGTAPPAGAAAASLAFLAALGFEVRDTNLYPGLGRQWILRRGRPGQRGYLERDVFSSFGADPKIRPAGQTGAPAAGDAVFRLPVDDPEGTMRMLREKGWAEPYMNCDKLFRGPDGMVYEIAPLTGNALTDRTVSIWTDPSALDANADAWQSLFGFRTVSTGSSFYGIAHAHILRRNEPTPVTLQLLTPAKGELLPRASEDIFAQCGYPHFRLGARSKALVKKRGKEVFPDTADVSYVLVGGAYLEVVEA